eukprot:scaffold55259_cov58-Attheya_sp.AAC.6
MTAVFSMLMLVTAGNSASAAFLVPHPSIGVRHSRRRMIRPVEATLLRNKMALVSYASDPGEVERLQTRCKQLEETLVNERVEVVQTKNINQLEGKMEKNFNQLEGRIEKNFNQFEERMEKSFQQMDKRMEKSFQQMDERTEKSFQQMDKRMEKSFQQMDKRMEKSFQEVKIDIKDLKTDHRNMFTFLVAMAVAGSIAIFKDFIPFFK